MPMYKLIEYSDVYLETSSLWQYYRDEPALDNNTILVFLLIAIIVFRSNLNNK